MKLMAKNAEDRYQSALGLKVDLETCLNQLYAGDRITNFRLGKLDRSGQFSIPQKLYGRANEVQLLLEAFDRVSTGTTEMMLVSGYSGIGKTSVINEIHKPIVRQKGAFITGKFDQFKKDIPYAALLQAFQEAIRQLLTENAERVAIWRAKLLTALAQNGQIVIDTIPELEYIIGAQPDVPQLGAAESQNRFHRVFQQFINVFAQPEHPLVLFLDDLQWADAASLKIIENLMCDPDSKYLLLIGAYRDNEVSPIHPALSTIERVKSCLVVVSHIVLAALELVHVRELIQDTLGANVIPAKQEMPANLAAKVLAERMQTLAYLVYNKTQGNPFFITQLLQTLYRDRLLDFDFVLGQWMWDVEKIQTLGITEYSVVELIARNIQKLAIETQHVLKLAACMGHQFSLDNLAIVNEKSF
ncbi:ATP-binding protein [Chroococcidiopsis sp. SAG 2025]|uniref:ATP-binding protein n=1 Tax=Chroococcidiopsis sp. SAG 2025 TaxID=171389 RepID=UPI002936F1E8|nr:AAA family ATPase [Chroococcidiopsis sp. SAG 2025]